MKMVREKLTMIKKQGINVYGSFIIGLPTETKEEINQTIKFALSIPLNGASFHTFVPYPRTYFYDKYIKNNSVEWESFSSHNLNPIVINKNISKNYLLYKQTEAYIRFYSKRNIIKSFHRFVK